eukprot:scaffold274280_cov19-Tisochrysis_lutea.AAC.1
MVLKKAGGIGALAWLAVHDQSSLLVKMRASDVGSKALPASFCPETNTSCNTHSPSAAVVPHPCIGTLPDDDPTSCGPDVHFQ